MAKFDKIKSVLGAVAPGLATALGGPLAGMAATAITHAITGNAASTEAQVEQAVLGAQNPQALVDLKKAEEAFQAQMAELGIDHEKIAEQDRESARAMQVQVKSAMPPLLAAVVIACCLVFEGYILSNGIPAGVDPVIVGRILGTLDSALMLILSYYFGSSAGSDRKTEIMAGTTEKK